MKCSILFLLCIICSLGGSFAQGIIQQWDSLYQAGKVEVSCLSELNSLQGDFAPILTISGKLLFTSERINPITREAALSDNQNIYEYDFSSHKVHYSYFYNTDDHSAIAGQSSDRKILFIYKAFFGGDLYRTSGLSDKQRYNKFKSMGRPINTDQSMEQSLALNGPWLVFSSNRLGSFDLYYGMVDENMKLSGIIPIYTINTDSDETDVRLLNDGSLVFSSNCSGQYKSYYSNFNGTIWSEPILLPFIPDSFNQYDIRDVVIYDSAYYFSSNKSGNYDIYCLQRTKDSVIVEIHDTIIVSVPDSIPIIVDTVQISKFEEKLELLEQKLDSMEFKPYKAYVQIGAYRFVKSIREFKNRFPAFDTTSIRTEYELSEANQTDSIYRYLINETYSTLRAAATRQQLALKQQADPTNRFVSPVDAFIAVYDNRNVRIVIFFNLEKDDYKILVGDKVVYF